MLIVATIFMYISQAQRLSTTRIAIIYDAVNDYLRHVQRLSMTRIAMIYDAVGTNRHES